MLNLEFLSNIILRGVFFMLNVLIADDNTSIGINILNFIRENHLDNVRIQGIALNGFEAYQKIKILKPDIVLLDIQMPILNGFEIINKLITDNFKIPKIILITAFPELISNFNKNNLISGILIKPFDFNKLNQYLFEFNNEEKSNLLNKKIMNVFSKFDFNTNSLGYTYLLDCVKSSIEHPELLKNFDKKLYPYISKMHSNSNPYKIKWNVEKSINSMFRYTNTNILNEFFSNKKPSPVVFINQMVKIIKKT